MINNMDKSIKKVRDFYSMKPDAPIIMKEFGYYCLDKWISQGHVKSEAEVREICGLEELGLFVLDGLGGCEAALYPRFDEEVLEIRGNHELARDFAGRHVLYFKGRRNGFMPEYVDHPVKDMHTWERDILWRLDVSTPERSRDIEAKAAEAAVQVSKGKMLSQYLVGGYMYLRSLIGPEELLYMFYDDPGLIHTCMEKWLELGEYVTACYQKTVNIDEVLFDEDICYKNGSLISPEMFNEFLAPYYSRFIDGVKSRQMDKDKKLHVHIATDGYIDDVIPLYLELGMDYLSPFEAAAGCDVLRTAEMYPDLLISGGMDKIQLASGRDAIDRMVDRILPPMKSRGGYIPTCDHGVPEEVPFEDYVYFRKRLLEFA